MRVTLVCQAGLGVHELQKALHELRRAEKLDVDEGQYRVVGGVERPKYRGEV